MSTGTFTESFTVVGMSCAHCVGAVSGELSKLPGVSGVEIELETGLVTVSGDVALDPDAVAAAIDEAGYELAETR